MKDKSETQSVNTPPRLRLRTVSDGNIVSFGNRNLITRVAEDGELYFTEIRGGNVLVLVPAGEPHTGVYFLVDELTGLKTRNHYNKTLRIVVLGDAMMDATDLELL